MNDETKKLIYDKLEYFLSLLSSGDADSLYKIFAISKPLFDEIEESLIEYFNVIPALSLAPFETAFQRIGNARPFFDIYEMNEKNHFGIECVIFANKTETEAILHVEFEEAGADFKFQYKYIGS